MLAKQEQYDHALASAPAADATLTHHNATAYGMLIARMGVDNDAGGPLCAHPLIRLCGETDALLNCSGLHMTPP
jgi:hypothetical protein